MNGDVFVPALVLCGGDEERSGAAVADMPVAEAASMLELLRVLVLIVVAVAMVPALAHALELPGKLRLTKDAYFAVQPIYYPGFTIAGTSEPVAMVATVALLLLTPRGSGFWLILVALLGLIGMHA